MSVKRGPWYWSRIAGAVFFGVVIFAAAARRAGKQDVGTDFHVFWQAGYDFAHGLPLYQSLPGARHFNYPPFAAQVFQILGLFPLKTAALFFYVASVGLILIAIWLTRDIVQRLPPPARPTALPLALAVLSCAGFMLDNLVHVQVNLLTFVLCLLGVQAFVSKREPAAAGWLVAATAIKITPVFFLAWAIIRGSRRTFAAIAVFGVLCLMLPVVQRGVEQGSADLTEYYRSFLHQFASGGVVTNYRNQNLAALIYRAAVPGAAEDVPPYEYAYLPSLAAAAPTTYRVLALVIFAALLTHLIRLRLARWETGVLEISSVFLTAHLLSGITWKAHLVTLLFVFYAFFSLDLSRFGRIGRIALAPAWAGIVVIGLGRDLVGSRLHHYMAGYSVFVWVMLLLFGLCVAWGPLSLRSRGDGTIGDPSFRSG
ncbi:MAG TPA: glycosyltransferase family 87 protein [Gemmatimonadales bacterium]|nr:glycosyltransferase family 87 protein [Gemmatimonadales bacterium]